MAAAPQESFVQKLLTGLKRLFSWLAGIAVDQVRNNPAELITAVATGVGNVASKKLSPAKAKTARGVIGAVAARAIKESVSPAAPEVSSIQKAADKAKRRLGR